MQPERAAGQVDGERVGNRYLLVGRIAGGGMGEVWRAHDEVLDRPVALKMLHPGLSDDAAFLERFRGEARNAAQLAHGNIAQVHDYGEADGAAYLVMELVEGQPLSSIIRARSPLSAAETVALIDQAAAALEAAHRKGIIHRDVKPANIVVTDDGVAKLTDFGIARALGAAGMTRAGEVLGTPQYLPPEAALGKDVGPASDVYSLAVVAYEMLTGEWPFHADTAVGFAMAHIQQPAPMLPGGVPALLAQVVHRGLAKQPQERFASAAEFGSALDQALRDSPADETTVDITQAPTTVVRVSTVSAADQMGQEADAAPPSVSTTVHPESVIGPVLLRPGQNAAVAAGLVEVSASVGRALGEPLDLVAFEVGVDGRALGDSAFVFYNNPSSQSGAVKLSDKGIQVDLGAVADDCHAVVVALADDHALGEQHLSAHVSADDIAFDLDTAALTDERAVILVRFYRRDGLWKARNIMAGWVDGLEPLVRAFGIDVS